MKNSSALPRCNGGTNWPSPFPSFAGPSNWRFGWRIRRRSSLRKKSLASRSPLPPPRPRHFAGWAGADGFAATVSERAGVRGSAAWQRVPDTLLLKALASGRKPAGWDAVLEGLRKEFSKMLVETFQNYMDIVLSAARGKTEEAVAFVQQADQLYLKRARDTNNFNISDGSGTYNDLMVDHRLAEIIQHCFGQHPGGLVQMNTHHRWRWGSTG